MSEENVEIVHQVLDSWNDGDYERALSFVDPNIEVEIAVGAPPDGTYSGHAGLAAAMGEFWSEFESIRAELAECVPVGDSVVLGVRQRGVGRSSGAEVEMWTWQIAGIRGGKVVRWRNFRTRGEALEAAGLSA